ncbi:MAG: hypothetical protein JOY81_01685 [Alphaproteobacteria bacterium]|nr:hypothetical protein [Alphaproteobacteria bacterium]
MRPLARLSFALAAFLAMPTVTGAATLGAADYAVQYDYREFYAATDNKPFRVVILGNPFPQMNIADVAQRLLPVMQAQKPPPRLAFTYDVPAEPPHPDYRMVLVFNPALSQGADTVCRDGKAAVNPQPMAGKVNLMAIYCRNDQYMSQVIGSTNAAGPDDPALASLLRETFAALFSSTPSLYPNRSGVRNR